MTNKTSYIEVNDIFDELIDENKRLRNYLKVSLKFKSFVELIIDKLKNNLDSNDLQEFQQLFQEVERFLGIDVNEEQIETNIDNESKEINDRINTSSDAKSSSVELSKRCDNKEVDKLGSDLKSDENIRHFVCNICGKYYRRENLLKRHIRRVHTKSQPISCDLEDCNKVFKNKYSLKTHQILWHLNKKCFSCDFPNCGYKCRENYRLNTHKIKHSKEKHFVCDFDGCAKAFKHKQTLVDHKKNHNSSLKTMVGLSEVQDLEQMNDQSIDLQEVKQLSKEVEEVFGIKKQQIETNSDNEYNEINEKINTSYDSKTSSVKLHKKSNNKNVDKTPIKCLNENNCSKKSLNKNESFICDFIGCRQYFESKEKLKKHSIIHTTVNKNKKTFICYHESCNFQTDHPYRLGVHLKSHKNVGHFICNICGNKYLTNNLLRSHLRKVHTNSQPIGCHICNKVFKNERSLKSHQKLIHLIKKFLFCEFPNCGYKCRTKNQMNSHKTKHTDERPFVCNIEGCAIAFRHRKTLVDHIKGHNSLLKCLHEGCGKTFQSTIGLSRHSNTHLGIRFKCEWPGCEYDSYHEEGLKLHMISHSQQRNFICDWPQCGKRFKTKHYLDIHYRIHTNDRKYVCHWPGCQYNCTSSSGLHIHLKNVHKKRKICS